MDWVQLHLALNHLPVIGVPILVVALGLLTALLYARAAHSGGEISHPELR